MQHQSYKEVKNFIHNEAGITKEWIRGIIQQTVAEEVRKVVTPEALEKAMFNVVHWEVRQSLSKYGDSYSARIGRRVEEEIGKQIVSRLDIKIAVTDK